MHFRTPLCCLVRRCPSSETWYSIYYPLISVRLPARHATDTEPNLGLVLARNLDQLLELHKQTASYYKQEVVARGSCLICVTCFLPIHPLFSYRCTLMSTPDTVCSVPSCMIFAASSFTAITRNPRFEGRTRNEELNMGLTCEYATKTCTTEPYEEK